MRKGRPYFMRESVREGISEIYQKMIMAEKIWQ